MTQKSTIHCISAQKTTHPRWNKSTLKNLLNSMENSSVACSSHILCKIKHSMNNPLNLFTFLSINYKYCLLTEKKKDYFQLVKTVTVLAQSISKSMWTSKYHLPMMWSRLQKLNRSINIQSTVGLVNTSTSIKQ